MYDESTNPGGEKPVNDGGGGAPQPDPEPAGEVAVAAEKPADHGGSSAE